MNFTTVNLYTLPMNSLYFFLSRRHTEYFGHTGFAFHSVDVCVQSAIYENNLRSLTNNSRFQSDLNEHEF
jgi:hypothetical protein